MMIRKCKNHYAVLTLFNAALSSFPTSINLVLSSLSLVTSLTVCSNRR